MKHGASRSRSCMRRKASCALRLKVRWADLPPPSYVFASHRNAPPRSWNSWYGCHQKKVKQKIGLLYLAKGGGLTLDKTIWSKYPPPIPKSLFLHAEIQMRECKYFTTEQMLNTAGNDAKGTFKNELLWTFVSTQNTKTKIKNESVVANSKIHLPFYSTAFIEERKLH